jgi:hypothetical protein
MTQLDASLHYLLLRMFALQISDVNHCSAFHVYEQKLGVCEVYCDYKWVKAYMIAWNSLDCPDRRVISIGKPFDAVELLVAVKYYTIRLVTSLAASIEHFVSNNFKLMY